MSLATELKDTVGAVTIAAGPSVVRIGRHGGRGAGVVIGDGLVLTNAHNMRGEETTVTFAEGRTATGTLKGVDADGDLVVLSVDTAATPPITWQTEDVTVGTPVFALAMPPGRSLQVTFGLVSALGLAFPGPRGRRIGGSIEHTAPLSRGSSGGPIVDEQGRLIGVNTHRIGDGFYLAIPADAELKGRIDALSRGESPRQLRLGVALAPAHAARRMRAAVGLAERDGLLVRGVQEDSPAARAGLRQGDLLVRAAEHDLTTHDDLYAALDAVAPGQGFTVKVVRGTEELDIQVSFEAPNAGS